MPIHYGQTKVLRWGNGLGVRIPLRLARRVGLAEGTTVNLVRDGRNLLITPLVEIPTLEDLLAGVAFRAIPPETEWRRQGRSP